MLVKTTIQPLSTGFLDKKFEISKRGSTVSREVLAGLTTFGAMSYIMVANPAIVSAAGIDLRGLIIATAVASMIGTLIMALWANLPIALAPGMGSNVIFANIVVLKMGVPYQTAFTMVLIGGVLFTILSVTRLRGMIVSSFPASIRIGIQCAIGLFVAYLGLANAGVVSYAGGRPSFGHLSDPAVLLALAGIMVTAVLIALKTPAAFLISIILITIGGHFVLGANGAPLTPAPTAWISAPIFPAELFMPFDFGNFIANFWLVLPITLYFFLSDFFGATATLISITHRAGIMNEDGSIPRARQAYLTDGIATMAGACVGSTTVTNFVESAAGVEAGGRTGLTGVVVAVLFGLAAFFWPLITIIPPQATAPTLILVGLLMFEGVPEIDFQKAENALSSILIILITVVTTDFMMGLALGCLSYTIMVAAQRKWAKLTPIVLVLDAIFLLYMYLTATSMQ